MQLRHRLYSSISLLLTASALLAAAPAGASVVGFQDKGAFDAATTGWSTIVTNFDAIAAGTSYAAGTGPAGAGFTMTLSGLDAGNLLPTVGNQFWTTSPSNYLGLDNPDSAFEIGDTLTFNFASPVRAFGFYVVSTTDSVAGNFTLNEGANSVSNAAMPALNDGANGDAFFLGFAASGGDSFSSASFTISSDILLLPATLDDIVVAAAPVTTVPEPASLALLAAGMLACVAARRRGRS